MLYTLIANVKRNNRLTAIATQRSLFLFMVRFMRPSPGDTSSVIIRRNIANTRNSKLRFERNKGGACVIYTSIFDIE